MAWAEVAVAATEQRSNEPAAAKAESRCFGAIVMAALALPAALPLAVQAEEAPEKAVVSLRYLHYQDEQKVKVRFPDYDGTEPKKFKRITAKAPSAYVLVPLGTKWSLEASAVSDDVSGATPRYYTDVSGATSSPGMKDKRTAGDLKMTRHFERAGVSLAVSHSTEHDYKSNAYALDVRFASSNNNTTLNVGVGGSRDKINPVNKVVVGERKRTNEYIVGVTHALTSNDLVQVNATYTDGRGYFNDPYKRFDKRPDQRKQTALLALWNHHFSGLGATLRSGYRYYTDSFGVVAHTVEGAWVQPVGSMLSLTPSVRYSTQSAADFYYDPVMEASIFPRPLTPQTYTTTDQRMSAFGAVTLGLKAELRLGDWTADVKYERSEQRGEWRTLGTGSPNLDPFIWQSVQMGVSTKF
ncbi:hypothetical protein DBR42_12555 [Pelomonas sp. HMWF004]|nr:hypothetical protein DBR42_12555 [Pelomonas sp. HMWF004]